MSEFIKYIGTSHIRKITREEWAGIPDNAVENQTVVWNAANGWTIPRSKISDEAWPYIKADPEFIVVGENDRQVQSADDPAVVDIKAYPPLMTAAGAEDYDAQMAADVTANEQLDSESGGVDLEHEADLTQADRQP
jgi:hypothetical protein